jgi:hypothetical protein
VAAAQTGAGLWVPAGEAPGRTHIDHLRIAGGQVMPERVEADDMAGIEPGDEIPGGWSAGRPGLERAALVSPLREAAVKDRDAGVSEDPKQPPRTGGTQVRAGAVVDDDATFPSHAEIPYAGLEIAGGRQHVRQGGSRVAEGIDVEESGPGDVARDKLLSCIPPARREVP